MSFTLKLDVEEGIEPSACCLPAPYLVNLPLNLNEYTALIFHIAEKSII